MDQLEDLNASNVCLFCNLFYSISSLMKNQMMDHVKNGNCEEKNYQKQSNPVNDVIKNLGHSILNMDERFNNLLHTNLNRDIEKSNDMYESIEHNTLDNMLEKDISKCSMESSNADIVIEDPSSDDLYYTPKSEDIKSINLGKEILDIVPSMSVDKTKLEESISTNSKKHKQIIKKNKSKYFPCDECNFVSRRQSSVRDHINKIHIGNNDKKSVTFTKKISSFSLSLIKGYLKRDLEENEKQEFCKLIKEGRDMDIYIKIWGHWKYPRTWECVLCSQKIKGELSDYETHFKEVHRRLPVHKCEICSLIIERKFEERSKSRKEFTDHMKTHLMEYPCSPVSNANCIFSSAVKDELNEHLERMHQIKVGNICNICEKKFKTITILKKHIKNQHLPQSPAACNICGKNYRREQNMKIHMLRCRRRNEKWPCEVCGRELCSKESLESHVEIHALQRTSYVCDYPKCNRYFLVKKSVAAHKQTEHSDATDHICQVCAKEFKLATQLKQHLITHQTDKPFNCEQCGKGFKVIKRLREHMNVHTGDTPYECGYCAKKIRSQANVFHHLKHHRKKNHVLKNAKEYFKVK